MLKKIALLFLSIFFYIILLSLGIFLLYQLIEAYKNSSLLDNITNLVVGSFFCITLINSVVLPKVFDKTFKNKIMENSETNFVFNIAPIPDSWLLELSWLRASIYAGAIFMYYTGWKGVSLFQIKLSQDEKFISRINIPCVLLSFMQTILLFFMILIFLIHVFFVWS